MVIVSFLSSTMPQREKPLLIYDGDCNFCRRWIARWKLITGDCVDYAPYQEVAGQFPEIPLEKFQASVQLIESDGKVTGGAEAVFRTLASAPGRGRLFWMYQHIPGFRSITEWGYRLVARNRPFFSSLTRFFWGNEFRPATYFFTRWLFLRALGIIYLIAFVSLGIQVLGLVGENGITPAQSFLKAVAERFGPERFWLLPTLCWLNAGDFFLQFLCGGGALLSIGLIIGFAEVPLLILLWMFYLSLATVCGEFLSFQWDILLLETGFLSIFFASLGVGPKSFRISPPSHWTLWLLRWLLFRLTFMSGAVKLTSGDPAWRSLTAMTYHYETQPLPTWIGWYAHQWPVWFQKISTVGMFVIELAVPFLIFAPRRLRMLGGAAMIGLQILILLTGNYCFFNLLTIALCLLLYDDSFWPKWLRHWSEPDLSRPLRRWPKWLLAPLAVLILIVSTMQLLGMSRWRIDWPRPLFALHRWVEPFHIVSGYGLFAVMTTSRSEIVVEGSKDAENWQEYEFKYKPGGLAVRPGFVQPHQPRLDWQMWFAALGSYHENPWFISFCIRLLQGSPEVLGLIKKNPFPDRPPRFVRALVYDYHFTDAAARREKGTWWRRELKGLYCPVISLTGEEGGTRE